MLDIHAVSGTPGAATVLGTAFPTIAVNDLAATPNVPNNPLARLIMWGAMSITANTIGAAKLQSQDLIDPINGELITLGSASLKNIFYKPTNVPYKTGGRLISVGTNTGVATGLAFTVDHLDGGPVTGDQNMRFAPNCIVMPQTLVADVALTWTTTGFAPATAIPNGKYAILGFYLTKTTAGHLIRFQHADFAQNLPGIPAVDNVASAILSVQEGMVDPMQTDPGYQFLALSDMTNKPLCPIFSVTNAASGLNIQSLAVAAVDTPVINLNLIKVG